MDAGDTQRPITSQLNSQPAQTFTPGFQQHVGLMCAAYIHRRRWRNHFFHTYLLCVVKKSSRSNLGRARRSCTTTQQSSHCLQWDSPNSPQNCLFLSDDHHSHLIHPSIDRPHSPSQTASRSIQPFCHSTLFGPTHTDTQTDTVGLGERSCAVDNWYKCKKTVVYHLVNGSTVLLRIENSKNDRLKVILLCNTLTFSQTATSNITFSLSFLLFSMRNNTVEPLTRW